MDLKANCQANFVSGVRGGPYTGARDTTLRRVIRYYHWQVRLRFVFGSIALK